MAMARLVKGLVNRLGIGPVVADFFHDLIHDLKVDSRKTKEMAVTGAVFNGQALRFLQL